MSTLELLQRQHCPPLDEALFLALASDFDVEDPAQKEEFQVILNGLTEHADTEQQLELLPPTQSNDGQYGPGPVGRLTSALHVDRASATDRTDNIGSITSGLSALTTSNAPDSSTDYQDLDTLPDGLEHASSSDKEAHLKELFPSIETIQITETIAKCNGDVLRSIEELLNLSFIVDDFTRNHTSSPVLKSVDAFASIETRKPKSKKKRRKQDYADEWYSESGTSSGVVTPNIWEKTREDVDFVVSRTQLSEPIVRSAYNQNNRSLAKTLKSLAANEARTHATMIDTNEILQIQAAELELDSGGVAENYIYGALLLSSMLPSAAKDLLDAMMIAPEPAPQTGKLVGIAQYVPLKLDDEAEGRKSKSSIPPPPIDPGLLLNQTDMHSARASTAFDQAAAAYKRGKSDKLMGGAAAYYGQLGQEHNRRRKELEAATFDAIARQQSTGTSVDLHGVNVQHAVRIARDRVEAWWDGLGDNKYRVGGIGAGYRIVVGVGTHSTQGIGRIGPAVSKMLMREGWKVNIQRGEILVEGKVRR